MTPRCPGPCRIGSLTLVWTTLTGRHRFQTSVPSNGVGVVRQMRASLREPTSVLDLTHSLAAEWKKHPRSQVLKSVGKSSQKSGGCCSSRLEPGGFWREMFSTHIWMQRNVPEVDWGTRSMSAAKTGELSNKI